MEKLQKVHLFFATDATQELARLLEILQNYKRENRIQEFSTLELLSPTTTRPKTPEAGDLIILLLSHGLKSKISELEKFLEEHKPKAADIKLVLNGKSMTYAAKTREEAKRIIEVIQHYGAKFTCYVGRPDPGMVYLKR